MEDRKIIYTTGFKAGALTKKKGMDVAKAWVDYRFEYWKRYTLNSLLNQDNPNWEYWFITEPTAYELLDGRLDDIEDERIKTVFRTEQWGAANNAGKAQYYLVLRLDSDDMYRHDVTDEMLTTGLSDDEGLYKYIQYTHGYIYKPRTTQVKEWWRKHMSPPFFARVYTKWEWDKTLANDDHQFELFDGGHEQARVYKRKLLPAGRFCVGVHDMNMVTTIGKRLEIFNEDDRKRILADFGVNYPESDFLKSEVHDPHDLLPGGFKG